MQREITSQADKKSCLVISQWTASCKVEEKPTVHMPKGQSILNIVKCSEEPIYFICWDGMCNITNYYECSTCNITSSYGKITKYLNYNIVTLLKFTVKFSFTYIGMYAPTPEGHIAILWF